MKQKTVKMICLFLAIIRMHAQSETDTAAGTEQEPFELEPVVVTADLWESELQKITASVSVLKEDQLDMNGVQHFEDVINAIPNVTWTGGSSRPRFIQIRGIGENSQFEGETPDSAVRFLIDDLDLTGVGTIGNLFDVSQVEVLRGPQAGAFGANAAGGVVRIVSNAPTAYWTGQIENTIGNDELIEAGVALGGPLLAVDPEQLTFRFSIHNLTQNGFRKNRTLNEDDTNERDEFSSRLKVRWLASEGWQLDGSFLYADFDNGYDEFTLNNEDVDMYSDEPGRDEQKTYGTSLRTSYFGFEEVDISYIAQYADTDSLFSYDTDWGAGFGAPAPFESGYSAFLQIDRDRNVYSNEIRFDSKEGKTADKFANRWTIGLFQQNLQEDSEINYFDRDFLDNAQVESDYETNTYSVFGQIEQKINNSSRLILGLRVERHEVDFSSRTLDNSDLDFDSNPDLLDGDAVDTTSELFGGKIAVEHDLATEHKVFASVARGYKAGGANTASFRNPTDPALYDDEKLWNYEIGLRNSFNQGRLNTQLTVFYLDREDAQLRDSSGSGGFFTYFTSNQGDAEHYGLEAEGTWNIIDDWTVVSRLGLLETELDNSGNDISNSPAYTYNFRIDYRPVHGFFAGMEVVGSDDYFESNSLNNREKRDAKTVVNGAVGFRWENWTLSIWAKNLFDEDYAERVFFFDNFDPDGGGTQRYEAPAAPRTFGVTANYQW